LDRYTIHGAPPTRSTVADSEQKVARQLRQVPLASTSWWHGPRARLRHWQGEVAAERADGRQYVATVVN
jgi:hypothetical protein